MKDRKSYFLMIFVIQSFLLLVLSSGCHTGRLSSTRHTQRNTVSTRVVAHSDSLSLSQQLQTACFQKLRLEHIELSPPDSLENQYIRSVTRVTEDRNTESLTTVSGDIKKEETHFINKEENVITNKTTKVSSSFWWGVVLLLVVVGGGWVIRKA